MKLIVAVFILMLCGCAFTDIGNVINVDIINIPNNEPIVTKTVKDYVIQKNYKLNDKIVAYIGSTMIRVEDYNKMNITETKVNYKKIAIDTSAKKFKFKGKFHKYNLDNRPVQTFTFDENSVPYLFATTFIDGNEYYIFESDKFGIRFIADEQGHVVNDKFISSTANYRVYYDSDMTLEPSIVKILNINEVKQKYLVDKVIENRVVVDEKKNNNEINFELIYSGVDASGLHIVYREYTKDGMARQAFYQNINYEKTAKTIRFKNTVIEILHADNQKIEFKVLSDDVDELEKRGKKALSGAF